VHHESALIVDLPVYCERSASNAESQFLLSSPT